MQGTKRNMLKILQHIFNLRSIIGQLNEPCKICGKSVHRIHTSKRRKHTYSELLWDTLIFNKMLYDKNIGNQASGPHGPPGNFKIYQSMLFQDISNRIKQRSSHLTYDFKGSKPKERREKKIQAEEYKENKKEYHTNDENVRLNKADSNKKEEFEKINMQNKNNHHSNSIYSFINKKRNLIISKYLGKNKLDTLMKMENSINMKKDPLVKNVGNRHNKARNSEKNLSFCRKMDDIYKKGVQDPFKARSNFFRAKRKKSKKSEPYKNKSSQEENEKYNLFRILDPFIEMRKKKPDHVMTYNIKKNCLQKKIDPAERKVPSANKECSYREYVNTSRCKEASRKKKDHSKKDLGKSPFRDPSRKNNTNPSEAWSPKNEEPFNLKVSPWCKKINLSKEERYPIIYKENSMGVSATKMAPAFENNDKLKENLWEMLNRKKDSFIHNDQKKKSIFKKKLDLWKKKRYPSELKAIFKKTTPPFHNKKGVKKNVCLMLNNKNDTSVKSKQEKENHTKKKFDIAEKKGYLFKKIVSKNTSASSKNKSGIKENIEEMNNKEVLNIHGEQKKVNSSKKELYPWKKIGFLNKKKEIPNKTDAPLENKVRGTENIGEILNDKKVSSVNNEQKKVNQSKSELDSWNKKEFPVSKKEIPIKMDAPLENKVGVTENIGKMLNDKNESSLNTEQKKGILYNKELKSGNKKQFPIRKNEIPTKTDAPFVNKVGLSENIGEILNDKKVSSGHSEQKNGIHYKKELNSWNKKKEFPVMKKEIPTKTDAALENKVGVRENIGKILNDKKVSSGKSEQIKGIHYKKELNSWNKIKEFPIMKKEIPSKTGVPFINIVGLNENIGEIFNDKKVSSGKSEPKNGNQFIKKLDPWNKKTAPIRKKEIPNIAAVPFKHKVRVETNIREILNRKEDTKLKLGQKKQDHYKENSIPWKKKVYPVKNDKIPYEISSEIEEKKKTDENFVELFDRFEEILNTKTISNYIPTRRLGDLSKRKVNPWKIRRNLTKNKRSQFTKTMEGMLKKKTDSITTFNKKKYDYFKIRKRILVRRMKALSKRKNNIYKKLRTYANRVRVLKRRSNNELHT